MSTIVGIISFLFTFYFMSTALKQLRSRQDFTIRTVKSVLFAALAAVLYALASKAPAWLAMLFLIMLLVMMIDVVRLFNSNGESIKEIAVCVILELALTFMAAANAARILDITTLRGIVGFVRIFPWVAFVISVTDFIIARMSFNEWIKSSKFDKEKKRYLKGREKEEDFEEKDSLFDRVRKRDTLGDRLRRWIIDEG